MQERNIIQQTRSAYFVKREKCASWLANGESFQKKSYGPVGTWPTCLGVCSRFPKTGSNDCWFFSTKPMSMKILISDRKYRTTHMNMLSILVELISGIEPERRFESRRSAVSSFGTGSCGKLPEKEFPDLAR